ncbi:hypothetical protein G6023_11680, partial [Dietzia sp. DQ11-71]
MAPQSAAMGSGDLILAAHPTFMSLNSLAVVLVGIAVLALFYRPDLNDYFRAQSPDTTGSSEIPLLSSATSAPSRMSP